MRISWSWARVAWAPSSTYPILSTPDAKAAHAALAAQGVAVHVYAADHGFNCDHRGSYDAEAARLARERTLAFFARHVG
jgi:carboxymethylenebutenolidase